jgi:hypothetical protein
LLPTVPDDRSGSDYQAVYSAALHVEQASLVRDDDELHPVPRLQLGWQVGHMCLDVPTDVQGGDDFGIRHTETRQSEYLAVAIRDRRCEAPST